MACPVRPGRLEKFGNLEEVVFAMGDWKWARPFQEVLRRNIMRIEMKKEENIKERIWRNEVREKREEERYHDSSRWSCYWRKREEDRKGEKNNR